MDIEQIREYTLTFPGVTEDMPFGEDFVVFRIEGKIFMCLALEADEPRMAIKLAPERNEELRALFDGITPAWHWNKKHWSDIYYGRFQEEQLHGWLRESYELVLGKLPKAVRTKYHTEKKGL